MIIQLECFESLDAFHHCVKAGTQQFKEDQSTGVDIRLLIAEAPSLRSCIRGSANDLALVGLERQKETQRQEQQPHPPEPPLEQYGFIYRYIYIYRIYNIEYCTLATRVNSRPYRRIWAYASRLLSWRMQHGAGTSSSLLLLQQQQQQQQQLLLLLQLLRDRFCLGVDLPFFVG